jgi:hypothetical protein
MKRGRQCGHCEYLGQDYPETDKAGGSYVDPEMVDMCQHQTAVATRTRNARILETPYAPHWCPKG